MDDFCSFDTKYCTGLMSIRWKHIWDRVIVYKTVDRDYFVHCFQTDHCFCVGNTDFHPPATVWTEIYPLFCVTLFFFQLQLAVNCNFLVNISKLSDLFLLFWRKIIRATLILNIYTTLLIKDDVPINCDLMVGIIIHLVTLKISATTLDNYNTRNNDIGPCIDSDWIPTADILGKSCCLDMVKLVK